MQEQLDQLAEYLCQRVDQRKELQGTTRQKQAVYIVALSGIPGSGKTSLGEAVAAQVNSRIPGPPVVAVVSLDGWHYTRKQLESFPDPAKAKLERGAPYTFDVGAFAAFTQSLRTVVGESVMSSPKTYPTFSHSLKDPVIDGGVLGEDIHLVIIEGLYVNLGLPEWKAAGEDIFHERWIIDVDCDVATQRVVLRHLATGLCDTLEAAVERATGSDARNATFIIENSIGPGQAGDMIVRMIKSVDASPTMEPVQ